MSKKALPKVKSQEEILNGMRRDWGDVRPCTVVFEDKSQKRERKYPRKVIEDALRSYQDNRKFDDY